jgi:hypothetical protein
LPPGSESTSLQARSLFDSDGGTDSYTDACGKCSRPGSSSFLDVSTLHLDAEVLSESESGFVLGAVPLLFLNTASSPLVAAFRIPEGFQRIARDREAHPGFPWERENNPGRVEASAGSAPRKGLEG